MSPRCREAFLLRKMKDVPVRETCELLGVSHNMPAGYMDNALIARTASASFPFCRPAPARFPRP
ncbi:sigma factor-like helix-turn-helix DNA-binding protein [Sphingomonas zeicaulis]|uniref:sigma factor-like helix-turn-helix DNA-binding protein n=1 Tax=Sphingomonas zeicaulis TaxID=1632740 RepID=UPI003D1EF255